MKLEITFSFDFLNILISPRTLCHGENDHVWDDHVVNNHVIDDYGANDHVRNDHVWDDHVKDDQILEMIMTQWKANKKQKRYLLLGCSIWCIKCCSAYKTCFSRSILASTYRLRTEHRLVNSVSFNVNWPLISSEMKKNK